MSDDEGKRRQERDRGARASKVLENDLYQEAWDKLRNAILSEWEAAKDTENRERLWLMLQLMKKLRGHLEGAMNTGNLARAQLAQIERKKVLGVF